MNFVSPEFLIGFPLVLLVYKKLPAVLETCGFRRAARHSRRIWLLAVSLGAYWYWNGWTTFIMIAVIVFTFLMAGRMERIARLSEHKTQDQNEHGANETEADRKGASSGRRKRGVLIGTVAVELSVLAVFKYTGWIGVLPVGISFYIFQTMSYVIDVYRGDTEVEKNIGLYGLYVSFFPQLVAGPIERSRSLLGQLHRLNGATRQEVIDKESRANEMTDGMAVAVPSGGGTNRTIAAPMDLQQGLMRILFGFYKKIVIADYLGTYVDTVYANPGAATGPMTILATVLFGFQIYCDFSGYSDIAIGCAQMMGIHLMENFRQPYLATSVQDFWHRWHISLTTWFTDYVYKPLGGSRKGLARTSLNILIVFGLSGIWHGAGVTFLTWGLLHGIYLIVERLSGIKSRALTLMAVMFAWIFFRAQSLGDAMQLLRNLGSGWSPEALAAAGYAMGLGVETLLRVVLSLFLLWLVPRGHGTSKEMLTAPSQDTFQHVQGQDTNKGEDKSETEHLWDPRQTVIGFMLILMIGLSWLSALSQNAESTFIYFRF